MVNLTKCQTLKMCNFCSSVQFTGISQQIVIAEIALKGCSLVSVGKGGPGCLEPSD